MAIIKGYNGQIAYIDLSQQKLEIRDLDPVIAEKYIGGVGLSAKLTWDLLTDKDYESLKKEPLANVNPLIFATGPLTGTPAPSSSRYSVSGISPLTGIWGESTSGGFFPVILRRCGFDAIVVTGEAVKPVYLFIHDGKIDFKDASKLWGKDTNETIEGLKEELADKALRVACIGKGGENLVKYACVINDEGRAAGRCGFGALMGKKKLKALAVKAKGAINPADKDTLTKVGLQATDNMQSAFSTNFFKHYGTLCYTDMGMVLADVPVNYFTSTEFIAEKLTGRALKEQYPVLKYACAGCTIGCGRTTVVKIAGKEVHVDGPEYETVGAYGPLVGIGDFQPILEANHICNLQGVDSISSGVSIAFLLYLAQNKLGTQAIQNYLKDIKLEDLSWGNTKVILQLLNKIIKREDIGDLLAEGVRTMAKKLGVDPGLAAHVKGLEIPMHDPRAYTGQALSYMTSCCGANHEKGDFFNIDGDAASFDRVRKGNRFEIKGREAMVATLQDIMSIFDSAVTCNFPHTFITPLGRMFKAATGFDSLGKGKTLFLAGERMTNLKRLISLKLGITAADDRLPEIVTRVFESGGSAGNKLDLADSLKEYYKARGWDEKGIPTPEKLAELGV